MELLLLVPTLILGFFLWLEKRETRVREDAWRLERTGLLNRIQVPELVPTMVAPEPSDGPLYVPFDDDEAYAELEEQRAAGEVQ